MDKTLIVGSPNLTGNVGSCRTEVATQVVNDGFWSQTGYTIATNSCTGHVDKLDYYSVGGGIVFISFVCVLTAGYFLGKLFAY